MPMTVAADELFVVVERTDEFSGSITVVTGEVVEPPTEPPIVPATSATAGIPGTWAPVGCTPPENPAALIAGIPNAVAANPSTAWTVAGQYVQTRTAGLSGRAYWNGTAWVAGAVPGPGPLPSDTIDTVAELIEKSGQPGTWYVVAQEYQLNAPLIVVANCTLTVVPNAADPLAHWTVDARPRGSVESTSVFCGGAVEHLHILREPGDLSALHLDDFGRALDVNIVGGGGLHGSGLTEFGGIAGGDDCTADGIAVLGVAGGYACYLQGDIVVRGFAVLGPPGPGTWFTVHGYGEAANVGQLHIDGLVTDWPYTALFGGGGQDVLCDADILYLGSAPRTTMVQPGYAGRPSGTGVFTLRLAGLIENAVELGSAWDDLTVSALHDNAFMGNYPEWAAAYAAGHSFSQAALGARAVVHQWGANRAYIVQWNGAAYPGGWQELRVLRSASPMRVTEAVAD
jgi:hypothetical protein